MTLEDLLALAPTETTNNSQKLFLEILGRPDWRCYQSTSTDRMEALIQRYLHNHARVPGLIGDTRAEIPLAVFGWAIGQVHCKGAVFLNGGVFRAQTDGQEPHWWLWIDHALAEQWAYPPGYQYLPDIMADKGEQDE